MPNQFVNFNARLSVHFGNHNEIALRCVRSAQLYRCVITIVFVWRQIDCEMSVSDSNENTLSSKFKFGPINKKKKNVLIGFQITISINN